ncbi:MAG: hypothetical protein V3T14_12470 [Myxococcota bacterium]
MSTILDALRKVERERRRRESGGDLGQTIVTGEGEAVPESTRFRRWIWIPVVGGVLFGVGVYGALLLGDSPAPAPQRASVASIPTAAPAAPQRPFGRRVARATPQAVPGRDRPARKLPPAQVKSLMASTPHPESSGLPALPTATPSSVRLAASEKESATPKPKGAQASPQPHKEKPQAVRKRRSKRSPSSGVPEKKPVPEPPKKAATVVENPPPKVTAVEPPPPFEPAEAPEVEDAAGDPPVGMEESDVVEVLSPVGFPLVEVRNVRWHPDPRRRSARIRIDRAGPLEVREGEIVSGVLIETIRPGTVVLQLGGRVRSFSIEP